MHYAVLAWRGQKAGRNGWVESGQNSPDLAFLRLVCDVCFGGMALSFFVALLLIRRAGLRIDRERAADAPQVLHPTFRPKPNPKKRESLPGISS